MVKKITRIGEVNSEFDVFTLKSVLIKNDAGDWGDEPSENSTGVIRSTNFTNQGKLDLSNVAYRSLTSKKVIEKKLFDGEIIIERSGGSDTQPVGRVGYIDQHIAKNNFVFANFIQRIAIDNTIESKFLFYCLQQMYEMGITASMQYQTTGIRNLDWKLYTKSVLPKPSKSEQISIVAILDSIDKVLFVTKNRIEKAERLKKSLNQNLLNGKLRPDGTWRKQSDFQETKIGSFPKEWLIKRVSEISEKVTDGEHTTPIRVDNGNYLLSARNIKSGFLDLSNVDYVSDTELLKIQKRCHPEAGDIFISCSGTIGNVCIVPEGLNCGLVRSVALIKLKKEIVEPEFIEVLFQSSFMYRQMLVSVSSSVQGNLFQGAIKKLIMPYPDLKERTFIVEQFKAVNKTIKLKQAKIQKLERLKKSLMQNLLIGKTRIKLEKFEDILPNK